MGRALALDTALPCLAPQVLAQQGLRSLPPDFDPDGLELTRYLLYGGILAVSLDQAASCSCCGSSVRVAGS